MWHEDRASKLRLRPQANGDQPVLLQLFGQARAAEFVSLGWSPEQLESFIYAEFKAQLLDYARRFPGARFDVIEVDAQMVGRFYVARRDSDFVIIDITVARPWRGKGIATHLIRDLQSEARSANSEIVLHVRSENLARQLYVRLGFTTVSADGEVLEMCWIP